MDYELEAIPKIILMFIISILLLIITEAWGILLFSFFFERVIPLLITGAILIILSVLMIKFYFPQEIYYDFLEFSLGITVKDFLQQFKDVSKEN